MKTTKHMTVNGLSATVLSLVIGSDVETDEMIADCRRVCDQLRNMAQGDRNSRAFHVLSAIQAGIRVADDDVQGRPQREVIARAWLLATSLCLGMFSC